MAAVETSSRPMALAMVSKERFLAFFAAKRMLLWAASLGAAAACWGDCVSYLEP
jgi:hypothetical protein